MQRNSKIYLFFNMAMLSAFGPFVTDFYLPALPNIKEVFQSTTSLVQLSLTFSLIGLALGQLLMGPLSDKYGRKSILLLSLGLFIISTIACLLSKDIYSFIISRFIQGVAGSGGIVISKSVALDLFEKEELSKFFSILGAIGGIAPICAPIFGGFVLKYTDFHAIFSILLGIGVVLFVCIIFFKESLAQEHRIKEGFLKSFTFFRVLRNKPFVLYTLTQALSMGVMFSFIASSSFIFQRHFGLDELSYSLCFAGAAIGITFGAGIMPLFRDDKLALKLGLYGMVIIGLLVCAALNLRVNLLILEVAFVVLFIFLGFILPSSTSLAMQLETRNSGNASAILGFALFAFGGLISPLTGINDIFFSTSIVIILCSLLALILGLLALRNS
ncbi:multidrug effflux MFS transporter [Helicobacter sp. MIT 14-3879]|uniref:multidrug effflux MFS transporter n=1 Tax=Helicobacter sp. MIT 14-3879 TaxID=2040649 RepID=UPI000E1F8750|nr:multidrug effflux MFS transporter [Helicobacter sp. MIT 14-3879]RDU60623.1 Bcr/CflA family drug resistance efflux transporter [Helicobacter sp. MIT 14-3879]